jgi:two-component system sensor histidine kinase MprB
LSFRARLTLVAAAAVALAIVLASAVIYLVVRGDLRGPVDDLLRARVRHISAMPPDEVRHELFGPDIGNVGIFPQIVFANGTVITPQGFATGVRLPVTKSVLGVAKGTGKRVVWADAHVFGTHVRTVTFRYAPGTAIELAAGLTTVDRSLRHIRLLLIVISLGGIAFASALGLLVSRAALAPVRRLSQATERVRETGDLSERIETTGQDELSQLAGSFNTMLAALEESTRLQRQLVTDASHELRTPLTSLRTNIEVLASEKQLAPEDRKRLLADVIEQLGEMTTLIAEVVELARGDRVVDEHEDVRLDLVTADAVERISRNRPGVRFETELQQSVVHGVPSRLERAIGNVLDNAAKWSPPGGDVEVAVRNGEVVVRDHGPGIDDEDLPHVFDRFYRARTARGMPGSGLGLAIVRQVAESHGGTVVAERAEGGGTRVTLRLNGARPAVPMRTEELAKS